MHVHVHVTAALPPLLDLWARLRHVWTSRGRGSAAYVATLELICPAGGIPGITAIVGLWLNTGLRTVQFATAEGA